jgi:antitoxin component of RelBE/YafQ-DinJ toxin-antitoxin module
MAKKLVSKSETMTIRISEDIKSRATALFEKIGPNMIFSQFLGEMVRKGILWEEELQEIEDNYRERKKAARADRAVFNSLDFNSIPLVTTKQMESENKDILHIAKTLDVVVDRIDKQDRRIWEIEKNAKEKTGEAGKAYPGENPQEAGQAR